MEYFVVMIDHGRIGREAIVDPEITRNGVISRITSGEYPRDAILFIHQVNDFGDGQLVVFDVKDELLAEVPLPESDVEPIDLVVKGWDHKRDLQKHGETV